MSASVKLSTEIDLVLKAHKDKKEILPSKRTLGILQAKEPNLQYMIDRSKSMLNSLVEKYFSLLFN